MKKSNPYHKGLLVRNRVDLIENNRIRYHRGTIFRVYCVYYDNSVWAEPVNNKGLTSDGYFDPVCFLPGCNSMEIVKKSVDRSQLR